MNTLIPLRPLGKHSRAVTLTFCQSPLQGQGGQSLFKKPFIARPWDCPHRSRLAAYARDEIQRTQRPRAREGRHNRCPRCQIECQWT